MIVVAIQEATVADQTVSIETQNLKPGDLVMGSEQAQIMVPHAGLYIDRIEEGPWSGVLVYWRGATRPEIFNPYWIWYVIRKVNTNGTTEEGPVL